MVKIDLMQKSYEHMTMKSGFTTMTSFVTSSYSDETAIVRPLYRDFKTLDDFYVSAKLLGIPEASQTYEYQHGILFKLKHSRQNNLMTEQTVKFYTDDAFSTLSSVGEQAQDRSSTAFTKKSNDIVFTELSMAKFGENQLLGSEYVDTTRTVMVNSAPYIDGIINILSLSIGDALWTEIKEIKDAENDGVSPYNLVSFDYATDYEEKSLPAAEDFFKIHMDTGYIRSKTFELSHVGAHFLNVTLADDFGSKLSFKVGFTVLGSETENKFGLSAPVSMVTTFEELKAAV